MQNDIEMMLAESRSLGIAGRFLHRYEKCRMTLASEVHAGGSDAAESRCIGQGNREQVMADSELIVVTVGDEIRPATWPPRVASASHFMTVFLEAYVAARQVSANSHRRTADKR